KSYAVSAAFIYKHPSHPKRRNLPLTELNGFVFASRSLLSVPNLTRIFDLIFLQSAAFKFAVGIQSARRDDSETVSQCGHCYCTKIRERIIFLPWRFYERAHL